MIQIERIAEAANYQATVMEAVRNALTHRTTDAIWRRTYREVKANVYAVKDTAREQIWSHEND